MRCPLSVFLHPAAVPDGFVCLAQVSVEGGKQKKEGKAAKKASRGSTPATDAATTSGGEDADADGEDRWDSECIECGEAGDPLLCCEVRACWLLAVGAVAIQSSCLLCCEVRMHWDNYRSLPFWSCATPLECVVLGSRRRSAVSIFGWRAHADSRFQYPLHSAQHA